MECREARVRFAVSADDEDDSHLGSPLDIEGLYTGSYGALEEFSYVEPEVRMSCLRLLGLNPSDQLVESWLRRVSTGIDLGNIWINILDPTGRVIGAYLAGSAELDACVVKDDGSIDAEVHCCFTTEPHAGAGDIWESWAISPPVSKNDWAGIPPGRREAWVEVAGRYGWTVEAKDARRPVSGPYVLEGENIQDLASFYCAIGEAINGPGGYYGSNLAALDDCLSGALGQAAPFSLEWHDFDTARQALGALETHIPGKSVLDLILECLVHRRVEIVRR